jgi:hypothetical protein
MCLKKEGSILYEQCNRPRFPNVSGRTLDKIEEEEGEEEEEDAGCGGGRPELGGGENAGKNMVAPGTRRGGPPEKYNCGEGEIGVPVLWASPYSTPASLARGSEFVPAASSAETDWGRTAAGARLVWQL